MKISFTIGADFREMQGKGASRRLRHKGKVPAILYGGHKEPRALVLDQQNLLTMIEDERFYSSIVQLKVGERSDAGSHHQGHPDAPGEERRRARGSAARACRTRRSAFACRFTSRASRCRRA